MRCFHVDACVGLQVAVDNVTLELGTVQAGPIFHMSPSCPATNQQIGRSLDRFNISYALVDDNYGIVTYGPVDFTAPVTNTTTNATREQALATISPGCSCLYSPKRHSEQAAL